MTADEALAAAWTYCAPQRRKDIAYPQGFWPDVARVAVEMALQETLHPELGTFRPTMCLVGNSPEPAQTKSKKAAGKISSSEKARNTALLLAALKAGAKP